MQKLSSLHSNVFVHTIFSISSDLINIFNYQVTVSIELPLSKYLDVEETAN